jgi:choline dehydrogenase
MQLYFQAFSTLIPRDRRQRPVLSPDPFSGLSIGLSNCRPTSRGASAAIARPASPRRGSSPMCYASTEADVAEMLAAVKMLRRIAAPGPWPIWWPRSCAPARRCGPTRS